MHHAVVSPKHSTAARLPGRVVVGLSILGIIAGFSLLGPVLYPGDPNAFVGLPNQAPSAEFWLGTTGDGKDVLAQTLVGGRSTLAVGLAAGVSVLSLGAFLGTLAGYVGGVVDEVISFFTNVFLVMPGLPLAVMLAGYLPQGPLSLGLVLTVTGWAWHARVIRAQALVLRNRDFVLSAQLFGETHLRIIFREILPNMRGLLFADLIRATLYAIGAQVGLEFLGLGDLSRISWGTNLYWAANHGAMLTGAWWTIVPTGLCVALFGFGLALLNTGLDHLANPRLTAESLLRQHLGGAAFTVGVTPFHAESEPKRGTS